MINNKFVDICGFEGFYQINIGGDVKSLPRILKSRRGSFLSKEKIMKSIKDTSRYFFVYLRKDGRRFRCAIHRTLAELFIPNPENKSQVNHINGVKTDNRLENLEWVSASENQIHAYKLGLHLPKRGSENSWYGRDAKGENSPNSKIICDFQTGIFYYGVSEAAEAKGISRIQLRKKLCGHRKNNTSLSYV
jgi:hypothetical protein